MTRENGIHPAWRAFPEGRSLFEFWYFLAVLDLILAVGFTLIVLSRKKRIPSVTLAWVFAFFFLPYLGFILFSLIGYRNLRLRKRWSPKSLRQSMDSGAAPGFPGFEDPEMARLGSLCEKLTGFPPSTATRFTIYEQASHSHEAMLRAIEAARSHIHLEYYIFQPDETGRQVRDALVAKAREGVRCRVLLDAIGSISIRREFLSPLRKAGAQVFFFGPGRITRPWRLQLRNHRKILVVDGETAFTGSQNIGNEYNFGKGGSLAWRDTQVSLQGPVVHQLQKVFVEDWQFTTGEDLYHPFYFPVQMRAGPCIVQTFPTGPDERSDALEMVVIQLIHQAKKRVTLLSPYFIPSVPLILALESAAQRGARVDVIVPKRSDSWIVDRASRSWFSDLLESGMHIYEYGKAFVHSKALTIDDRMSLIGSANMDERSFKLNFECSLMVYDSSVTRTLVGSFDGMRIKSRPILLTRYRRQPFLTKVSDGVFRILSPLL